MLGLHALAGSPLAAVATSLPSSILADAGSYVVTGQDVDLFFVRNIVVETGAYTLDGQAIQFIRSLSAQAFGRIRLFGTTGILAHGAKMIANFMMTAGDSKTLVVTVKDANGDAVNITDATVKWVAARSFGKAAAISKTTGSGVQISDGANGVFTVTLDPEDTEELLGNYYHEAQVTASDGTISTVLFGTMKINPALIEAT